ncbi:MAG: 2-thiouracil desulfurase family protein, partial [Pseudomonadota bacterium]
KSHDAAHIIARWQDEGRLTLLCPEVAVGFPTPRPPAEIVGTGDSTGDTVLDGSARVVERTGADVSDLYVRAARDTVDFARRHSCTHAVLTDGSPSCGSTFIYDGSFTGARKPGVGTTTAALQRAGVQVWPEARIAELDALLRP